MMRLRFMHLTGFYLAFLLVVMPGAAVQNDWFAEAQEAHRNGNLKQAEQGYLKAIASKRNTAAAHFNLANLMYSQSRYKDALSHYMMVTVLAPDYLNGRTNLAVNLFQLGDCPSAMIQAEKALQQQSDLVDMLLLKGACAQKLLDNAAAVSYWEQAYEINPFDTRIPMLLAEAFLQLERPAESLQWIMRMDESGMESSQADMLAVEIFSGQGELHDLDRALFHLDRAIQKNPDQRWLLFRQVEMLAKAGRTSSAILTARQASLRFVDFPDIALQGGRIALAQNDLVNAQILFEIASSQGSDEAQAYLGNIQKLLLVSKPTHSPKEGE